MELYCSQRRHRPFLLFVFLCVLLWRGVSPASLNRVSDQCDWFGSGLEDTSSTGIHTVYLRCTAGRVRWEYPRGAVRVVLRAGGYPKDCEGCLRVTVPSSGVSLYLEGRERLHLLHRHSYGLVARAQRCFSSVEDQVTLFLESYSPDASLQKEVFEFIYDLRPMRQKPHSECSPCSTKELIYAFCSSDFVARGTVLSLNHNEDLQRTEMTISGREILRDSEPRVFSRPIRTSRNETVLTGVVHRPLQCDTKLGHGDFVFFGTWRLGDPMLNCVPRWTEWKKVRRKAAFSNNLDCVLH
ncbi:meteorin-like protein [Caerostris extrusa]|uniref:Meteorin-like protein n=1 Tax=Caerostris extrusa TaxID=172846 RepID=A0AAV4QFW0_CAEEX|nr:meteorin-like protein [Caerostris extrusa]